jgi:hypothetical protein
LRASVFGTVNKLLWIDSEIRSMWDELLTLELTPSEAARFEAALTTIERRARRLLIAAAVRKHGH